MGKNGGEQALLADPGKIVTADTADKGEESEAPEVQGSILKIEGLVHQGVSEAVLLGAKNLLTRAQFEGGP